MLHAFLPPLMRLMEDLMIYFICELPFFIVVNGFICFIKNLYMIKQIILFYFILNYVYIILFYVTRNLALSSLHYKTHVPI